MKNILAIFLLITTVSFLLLTFIEMFEGDLGSAGTFTAFGLVMAWFFYVTMRVDINVLR